MKGKYLARKPLDEMIGEGFREIGVLVLVLPLWTGSSPDTSHCCG